MVVFGQSGCISAMLFHSGKIGCNWAKVVVFGQKLYSVKSGSIGAKDVLYGQNGCIWAKLFYSGKSS